MINFAKKYLNTGRHYIKFNIDEGKVEASQFKREFDFGKLRKIKKDVELTLN